MSDLLLRLGLRERRGSKPRCHWLTHGTASQVAARLTTLAAPWGHVSPGDRWMPEGFEGTGEAQLHLVSALTDSRIAAQLGQWWLPQSGQKDRTPNFDIASKCTIEGRSGLLLIEAKAHDEELKKEAAGRKLGNDATDGRKASHMTIDQAMLDARTGLQQATSLAWHISRDSHYQMSNRFAWAWKLTELGVPTILIYLGFLNAGEMKDQGTPFSDHSAWDALVRAHSATLFPDEVWNRKYSVNGIPFIPLIRSTEHRFDCEMPS